MLMNKVTQSMYVYKIINKMRELLFICLSYNRNASTASRLFKYTVNIKSLC